MHIAMHVSFFSLAHSFEYVNKLGLLLYDLWPEMSVLYSVRFFFDCLVDNAVGDNIVALISKLSRVLT